MGKRKGSKMNIPGIIKIVGLVKDATYLIGKFMDGKKTKTGAAAVAAGAGLSALTVFGVTVTPEMIQNGLTSLLGVFNLNLVNEADNMVGVLFGNLVSVVGAILA